MLLQPNFSLIKSTNLLWLQGKDVTLPYPRSKAVIYRAVPGILDRWEHLEVSLASYVHSRGPCYPNTFLRLPLSLEDAAWFEDVEGEGVVHHVFTSNNATEQRGKSAMPHGSDNCDMSNIAPFRAGVDLYSPLMADGRLITCLLQ
jgi:hypothetical protein